jgi:hypothetical protein
MWQLVEKPSALRSLRQAAPRARLDQGLCRTANKTVSPARWHCRKRHSSIPAAFRTAGKSGYRRECRYCSSDRLWCLPWRTGSARRPLIPPSRAIAIVLSCDQSRKWRSREVAQGQSRQIGDDPTMCASLRTLTFCCLAANDVQGHRETLAPACRCKNRRRLVNFIQPPLLCGTHLSLGQHNS